MHKQYIVLYIHGGRYASLPLTLENLAELQDKFCLSLIQKDANGTEHYNVLATRTTA